MRIVIAALVLVPALALADTPDAQKMNTDDCARARKQNKTCVLDMGTETLEGTVGKGDGEKVDILTFGKLPSLIRIRRDFIVEILKSAEDL
ncbi:MAG TPA: hypothetical protein VIV40_09490 [Kofleriaceae bacterium]